MSCRVRFDQTAAVIVMRFIVYAIVFATSFTVVALLIVLAIPIGTAINCPICTNKTAIALIALGSASAGAVLGLYLTFASPIRPS
jgi:hypothetical protein